MQLIQSRPIQFRFSLSFLGKKEYLPAVLKEEYGHEKEHPDPKANLAEPSDTHPNSGHHGNGGNSHDDPDYEYLR